MIILTIIKVVLGIGMIFWLKSDETLLDMIKIGKTDDDMSNDDYQLTCLENICVANVVHYWLGLGFLGIVVLRLVFVEIKMTIASIVLLVIILALSICKTKMISELIDSSIAFDRIRDYEFCCFRGWILEAGESTFEFEEEEDKEAGKEWFEVGIRIVYTALYIEIALFYLVTILL